MTITRLIFLFVLAIGISCLPVRAQDKAVAVCSERAFAASAPTAKARIQVFGNFDR